MLARNPYWFFDIKEYMKGFDNILPHYNKEEQRILPFIFIADNEFLEIYTTKSQANQLITRKEQC